MKEFFKNIPAKYKNIYFWAGIVGAIAAASGITLTDLSSWSLVWQAIASIVTNPVALIGSLMAVVAMWNDNGTPGLS